MLHRLDAHIASLLANLKHPKSEIGLVYQSYIEKCQMSGKSPNRQVDALDSRAKFPAWLAKGCKPHRTVFA